ncbi:uncharacterized protein [Hyperolius riggenbachi]|uniref:uncharacterized protein n=1 Tax=Hyperolius riggenbachi TaxID=752182 RepID=UPI0035A35608
MCIYFGRWWETEMPKCIAKHCSYYSGCKWGSGVKMHSLPRDEDKIQLWLQNAGYTDTEIPPLKHYIVQDQRSDRFRMCSRHFLPEYYELRRQTMYLKEDAVPTVFEDDSAERPARKRRRKKTNTTKASTASRLASPSCGFICIKYQNTTEVSTQTDEIKTEDVVEERVVKIKEEPPEEVVEAYNGSSQEDYSHGEVEDLSIPVQQLTFVKNEDVVEERVVQIKKEPPEEVVEANVSSREDYPYGEAEDPSIPVQQPTLVKTEDVVEERIVKIKKEPPEEIVEACIHTSQLDHSYCGTVDPSILVQQSAQVKENQEGRRAILLSPIVPTTSLHQSLAVNVKMENDLQPDDLLDSALIMGILDHESCHHPEGADASMDLTDPHAGNLFPNGNENGELPAIEKNIKEPKFIVCESAIDKLLMSQRCPEGTCFNKIMHFKKTVIGTQLIVHSTCEDGHYCELWESQPKIEDYAAGNYLLGAEILFSAMPSCIVKGCKHHTSTKTSNPLFTMHVFPREFRRIKLWLQQMNQDFGDIDAFATKILEAANTGKYRICSAHFEPGCYTAIGRRLLLKPDSMPTIFPGMCPQPTDWRLFPLPPVDPHFGPQPIGPPIPHDSLDQLKSGFLKKDAVTQTNEERHPSINTSLMEKCNLREEIFDANGRLVGVFSPDTKQRDLKTRPGLWTYDWSTKTLDEPSTPQRTMENKEALSSLEKVLTSLLQHMAETPHSRPQKQRTSRLLNRFADLISILTGEEWTVVKKNAHISKFYKMIREVPIKCGDVAMFFSMDEWEYIEEHEEQYKPVMLENYKDAKDTVTDTATDSPEDNPEDKPEEKPIVDELLRAAATNSPAGEEVPAPVQRNSDCAADAPAAPAVVIKKEEEELVPCTKQPTGRICVPNFAYFLVVEIFLQLTKVDATSLENQS